MSTTFVSSGVTSSGLIETGGNTLEVLNGGSAVSTTLSSGGQLLVDSGGYAAATTISSGGSATISAGGAMSGTGSGSTGVACAMHRRGFVGIERERKYFDIACERISRAQAQGRMFQDEPMPQMKQEALI